ncbi:hypothetical protein D3C79_764280 [compost metagenome]
MAHEAGRVRGDPRRQQFPDLVQALQVLHGLMGQPHELPAAITWPARNHGGRPRRVAPLADVWHIQLHAWLGLQVDHQPVFLEAQVLPVDAALAADQAIGAIGTDHVACLHLPFLARLRLPFALGALHTQLAAVGVLIQRQDLPALMHLDVANGFGSAVEDGLQGRLIEQVAERAVADRLGGPVDFHQYLPVGVEPLVAGRGLGNFLQRFFQPHHAKDATDLVVMEHRTRQWIEGLPTLIHCNVVAHAPEEDGEGLSDRAVTDDGYIVNLVLVHLC